MTTLSLSNTTASKGFTESIDEKPPALPYSTFSLNVDYQWTRGQVKISFASSPDEPVYVASCFPNLRFKRISDNVQIGTGTTKAVSINPEYTLGTRKATIQAESRVLTRYTHLSHNYGSPDSTHVMHWRSSCGLKTWDFVCYDADDTPIARFHSNVLYTKKVGRLDFSDHVDNQALREELMVVALTMYNQMLIRMNNPFSLLGMIPSPHPHKEEGA